MAVTPVTPLLPNSPGGGVNNLRGIVLIAFGFLMFSVCDVQAGLLRADFGDRARAGVDLVGDGVEERGAGLAGRVPIVLISAEK